MLDISTSTASLLLVRLTETPVEATAKSLVTSVELPPDPPEPPGVGPEDPPPPPQLTLRATVTNDISSLQLAITKLLKLIRD
jgi:hypothetical protein